jgi:DNA-binding response OmpR family regulator
MTDAARARVLLVEDDAVVVETLASYLEHAGFEVTATRDGQDGLTRAQAGDFALVILDWMVPGLSGPDVCRRLRATSDVPVMMLTARTAEDDRVRGLEIGADDYVPKPFSPREVVARVQALLRRRPVARGQVAPPTRVGELEVDHFRREVRVAGRPVPVTPTELKLVEALVAHPGRTFSRDELVARAFGPDYDGLDRTVDTHITNLRRKLESGGSRRLIHTVHGLGYRLQDHDR